MQQIPFIYDTEGLHSIAADHVIKQGLGYFSDNRVFELDMPGDRLTAQVEDAEDLESYWVELRLPG